MKIKRKNLLWISFLSIFFVLLAIISSIGFGYREEHPDLKRRPIVFVHGAAGSVDQFSLQAQRFASNGYPAGLISGFEYDSTLAYNSMEDIISALDAHIDAVLKENHADEVELLGHSMGTMIGIRYLNSNKKRASKVAHYVNIDGIEASSPPGGIPTLAIWAPMSSGERNIIGARNITLPGQTLVQVASSAESFAEIYKFFTWNEANTVDVEPEDSRQITLAGRLVVIGVNQAPEKYTIDIYDVDPDTGMRIDQRPVFTQAIASDGKFRFSEASADKTYEFVAHSSKRDKLIHHFYYEPFIRSNLWIRLKLAEKNGVLSDMVDTDTKQTNLIIIRNKELVGDAQNYPNLPPIANDSLTIMDKEICSETSMPASNRTVGLCLFDARSDGQSDLTRNLEDFASLPFISGIDLFIPGETPPSKTISMVLKGRQNGGLTQVINVPNWCSTKNKVTIQFHDF